MRTAFDRLLARVLETEDAALDLPDEAASDAPAVARDASELSERERHVLAHATAWDGPSRLFRNYFCAGDGHDEWATLQALCARGLMRVTRAPSALTGGDTAFAVTAAGLDALSRTKEGRS